ncbi:serine protease [bacterium]|nr:serine protease [bacterium]
MAINEKQFKKKFIGSVVSLLSFFHPITSIEFVGLGITVSTVLLSESKAFAQDKSNALEIAEKITVLVEGATQGSGVIVKKNGNVYTVLTAWHVIKDNRPGEELVIKTMDGKSYFTDIKKAERIGELDMAIITFESQENHKLARISSKDASRGDVIINSGHPIEEEYVYLAGIGGVIANAEVGIEQGYQLLYNNQTYSGMSGGPLINRTGELVGIHGRGERSLRSKTLSQNKKTSVNQGIPIYFYNLYSKGLPIKPKSSDATSWDDYRSLTLNLRSNGDAVEGYEQSGLRFIEEMIKLKPKRINNYVLKVEFLRSLGRTTEADNIYNNEFKSVVNEWNSLRPKAMLSLIDRKDPQKTADMYSNLMDIDNGDLGIIDVVFATTAHIQAGNIKLAEKYSEMAWLPLEQAYRNRSSTNYDPQNWLGEEPEYALNVHFKNLGDIAFYKKDYRDSFGYFITAMYWADKAKYDMGKELHYNTRGDLFFSQAQSLLLYRNRFDKLSCGLFRSAYILGNSRAKQDQVFAEKCGLPKQNSTTKDLYIQKNKKESIRLHAKRACDISRQENLALPIIEIVLKDWLKSDFNDDEELDEFIGEILYIAQNTCSQLPSISKFKNSSDYGWHRGGKWKTGFDDF